MALSANAAYRLKIALADPTAAAEVAAVIDAALSVGGTNTWTGANTFSADVTLGSGADLVFSGTTGQNQITVTDNLADALSVKIAGGNDFIVLDSTDSNEKMTLGSSGQKLGFLGTTPAALPTAYTQTYATADRTHASPTAAALTDSSGGTADQTLSAVGNTMSGDVSAAINNNFAECADEINKLIADLADLKQLVNAILDDLQAYGLLA